MAQGHCDTPKRPEIGVTPTEKQIYDALEGWFRSFLPPDIRILEAQNNRAAPPEGPFLLMLIVARRRYATNRHTLNQNQTQTITQPMLMTVQVSVFREGAGDAAALMTTLWRDAHATTFFRNVLPCITAIKSSEPRQNVWINASDQYVDGWNLDLTLDVQTSTTVPSSSALHISTDIMPADLLP